MPTVGESTSLAERKRRAGQRLVIGIAGKTVTSEVRELVRELQPAGFILFSRNVGDPVQVRDLNRALAELLPSDRPPILSVDQEGGRVQRIRAPATVWPSMRTVGRARSFTYRVAEAQGKELRAMGFNLNFAPVADVDSNPDNPVIGDRSFGTSPLDVGVHVSTYIMGLQGTGMMACAKHFPGHGDTDVDSHLALPVVDRSLESLQQTELPPFRAAVQAGVASIMTAHVVFPAIEKSWPSTLTPEIQKGILRDQIGFKRLLFTDDLEMKAVHERYALQDQVRRTYLGTVDLMLVCHTPSLQLDFFAELVKQQEQSREIEALAVQSHGRLSEARRIYLESALPAPGLDVVGSSEHLELADEVEAAARRTLA